MDNSIDKTPLHLQVYKIVKTRILSGEWKRGERIVESRLGKELGVSNSPVREGLRMLEKEEFLKSASTGLIVNPMEYEDIAQAHECRIGLEPYAARLAADRIDNAALAKLQECIAVSRKCLAEDRHSEVFKSNTAFHDLIIASCGNTRICSMMEAIYAFIVLTRFDDSSHGIRTDDYLSEHQALLDALKARDGALAEKIARKHAELDLRMFCDYHSQSQKAARKVSGKHQAGRNPATARKATAKK